MADEEKDQYEVETIIQAKVMEKVKGKIYWNYYVRWKGYGNGENTWEPPESFDGGSEHFLAHFWERVDLGGRDINDANSFKEGEMLFPVGPPRGKRESLRRLESTVKAKKESSASTQRKHAISIYEHEGKEEPVPDEASEATGSKRKRKRGRSPPPSERRQSTRPKRPRASNGASSSVAPSKVMASPRERLTRRSAGDLSLPLTPAVALPVTPRKKSVSPVKITPSRQRQEYSPSVIRPSVSGEETELRRNTPVDEHTDVDADGETDPDVAHEDDVTQVHDHLVTASPSLESSTLAPTSASPLPARRTRSANPPVEVADDPSVGQDLSSVISTEAKLSGRLTLRDPPSSKQTMNGKSREVVGAVKPPTKGVPARQSSLLTARKGKLQTLRGKYVPPPASNTNPPDDSSSELSIGRASIGPDQILDFSFESEDGGGGLTATVVPPTGEELLEAAGLVVEDAQALPDFEDVDMPATAPLEKQSVTLPNGSTVLAELAPRSPPAKPWLSTIWGQATIFGPLGFSANTSISAATNATSTDDHTPSRPFLLSLNPETAVPIALKDISLGSSIEQPSLDTVIAKCQSKGPPGKLYKDPSILTTLRTGGSSARVVLHDTAEDKHTEIFSEFYKLLDDQTLFLAVAADAVLAFLSSESRMLAEKLGIPAPLIGLGNTVIVSHVSIKDHCAFADLAVEAENVRL
ncbi:hypothetical protein NEOLEDRAFT_1131967 [Neolentinus lepideus HHB14362 ss-1]|uniref:Chromo domain-containing protein n=1 Tax=Neolentinus lepideus HHB14362 ss-1 TaxID=1314782 RepID=A0A165TCR7_9AGAM|nr:hypothetical protein NEOLEDRAFT_1131967 [Neolentinus lepideus HHB14362 ss-1]